MSAAKPVSTRIYAGGALAFGGKPAIEDLKAAKYSTVIIWSVHVEANGDLAQFARAGSSPGIGDELLSHAVDTAHLALAYVGATVLVVDPFDEQTANMWQEPFGFQDSEQPVPGNPRLRRQWLSLQS